MTRDDIAAYATGYDDHLATLQTAVEVFIDVLARERELLAASPVSGTELARITEEKHDAAQRIETLEHMRRDIARTAGADMTYDDRALAEQLGCGPAWTRLLAGIVRARHANERNGAIIQARLRATRARLDFLQAGATGPLYTARGQALGSAGRGRLHAGA